MPLPVVQATSSFPGSFPQLCCPLPLGAHLETASPHPLMLQPRLQTISVLVLAIRLPSCFWDPKPTLLTSSGDQIAVLPRRLGLVIANQPPGQVPSNGLTSGQRYVPGTLLPADNSCLPGSPNVFVGCSQNTTAGVPAWLRAVVC